MVLSQRVSRCRQEDCLQQDEAELNPAKSERTARDSVTQVRDQGGHTHVCVKLIVPVMNVDQQGKGIDPAGEPREIEVRWPQASDGMKPVHYRPADRGDRHTNGQRGDS